MQVPGVGKYYPRYKVIDHVEPVVIIPKANMG